MRGDRRRHGQRRWSSDQIQVANRQRAATPKHPRPENSRKRQHERQRKIRQHHDRSQHDQTILNIQA
jgi:hypothetical protein